MKEMKFQIYRIFPFDFDSNSQSESNENIIVITASIESNKSNVVDVNVTQLHFSVANSHFGFCCIDIYVIFVYQ